MSPISMMQVLDRFFHDVLYSSAAGDSKFIDRLGGEEVGQLEVNSTSPIRQNIICQPHFFKV
jgi:hypothetical protein